MSNEVSAVRIHLLRIFYVLNFAGLTYMVWPSILKHGPIWDPLHGVALSFWAALGLLMALGIRSPLAMLPLVLIQLTYKSIWIAAVLLPMWSAGEPVRFTTPMITGIVFDLIVIPWPYVISTYVRGRRDLAL